METILKAAAHCCSNPEKRELLQQTLETLCMGATCAAIIAVMA